LIILIFFTLVLFIAHSDASVSTSASIGTVRGGS
jgi:hypothetical protein